MSDANAFVFWGGVKIPFTPPIQDTCDVTVVVNYVGNYPGYVRLPKVYWRANGSPVKTECPIGTAFTVTIPLETENLEFFLEYSTERINELTKSTFTGTIEVTIDAGEGNVYLPTFGVRKYTIQLERSDGRSYVYPFPFSSSANVTGGVSRTLYTQNFHFNTDVLRAMAVRLLDVAGNPIDDGGSEAAQAASGWNEIPDGAPWPLFSSGTNIYEQPGVTFLVQTTTSPDKSYATGVGVWNNTPVVNRCFVIPAFTTAFRFQRAISNTAVPNALAAAKASRPEVTRLYDRFIFAVSDAGIHSPSFIGVNNRIVPRVPVVTEYLTTLVT